MQQPSQPFHFSGNGSEYFRIWIVNVGLSILTLGIYSAWAKVRRNQYFYRHTHLAGAGFDYHGDPVAILKGRLIAFVLFVAYSLTGQTNQGLGLMLLLLIMTILPWLLVKSFRFRLHNSSYRGLRFAFHGDYSQAYFNFFLWPLLSIISFGLLWPMAKQRIDRYIRNHCAFANGHFAFSAEPASYYAFFMKTALMAILIMFAAGAGAGFVASLLTDQTPDLSGNPQTPSVTLIVGVVTGYLALFVLAFPYAISRLQNLLWNSTRLEQHQFRSTLHARGLAGVMISNLLLTILTLGFYKPFADIRMARYRFEHLELLPHGDIDDFVAGQQSLATPVGDEVVDMFDFDIAL